MPLRKKLRILIKRRADTPWMSSMTDKYGGQYAGPQGANDAPTSDPNPTMAAFAPNQNADAQSRSRASVLIHQKSPLLLATPPQVTRVLAYSHPFILPLNYLAGLISWSTGDPWESFLLVAAFWFTVLYGDVVLRYTGPLVLVVSLIFGLFSRRYSPLSSTTWSSDARKGKGNSYSSSDPSQRKSLDEIVNTLQTFTTRCTILLEPFLRLTDFLSTQATATSATTRPALTTLFIRILLFSPVWLLLTLPPLHILTAKRVVLAYGTLLLSWHSRPARVSRTILWRSRTVRSLTTLLTGLRFSHPASQAASAASTSRSINTQNRPKLPPRPSANSTAKPGVRFPFTIYENQRRWIGLGWTVQMLVYERQNWSDEHLNEVPPPAEFPLPETDYATTRWQWAEGSAWRVEGAKVEGERSAKRIGGGGGGDESGWTYYDGKWRDGRRTDGWGRYTRRRKWVRDAELVEVDPSEREKEGGAGVSGATSTTGMDVDGAGSIAETVTSAKRGWFVRRRTGTSGEGDTGSVSGSAETRGSRDGPEEDVHTPLRFKEGDWGREIGEGLAEGLG